MVAIKESWLPNLVYRGKVRDTHDVGDGLLLMVATDRISAFDVVLPNAIPDKGIILSQLSAFWFHKTKHLVPNPLVAMGDTRPDLVSDTELARRSMLVKKAERLDVECIARGYITGSAWSEYLKTGTVSGQSMPCGMKEGDMFPEPLFTPTTKAEEGHDENMTMDEVKDLVGEDLTNRLETKTKEIYKFAQLFARSKGIIIADTKMEFGLIDGELSLIDELLTPDSSRFWDTDGYAPGKSQPNFDKQFVRDWLNTKDWDRNPPAPKLPDDIVEKTRERYLEAAVRLTGRGLS